MDEGNSELNFARKWAVLYVRSRSIGPTIDFEAPLDKNLYPSISGTQCLPSGESTPTVKGTWKVGASSFSC